MKRLVLDASVAAKWYLEEQYSDAAFQLASREPEWVIPDLFFAEMGNVFWKKVRGGEMDEADAKEALTDLLSFGFKQRETRALTPYALELAVEFQCSVYDGLYLAVAIDENCPLITADQKFYRIFSKTALGEHLLWIEDLK
uniref:Type II toxin-antitoxin system VapC family toxin n=1 Tax=Candidatus Desulfatibia profunda TaxID=2841695 RepID=A0A8J6NUS6_9BACT|nr:type II toxin-antitoxin system VapC family toxin [Candidatus Desulfatibia profunda]